MSRSKAQNLVEVSRVVSLGPLEPGDPYYADLSAARGTRELRSMRQYLQNCLASDRHACAVFIGHRGSGKTTELRRLEGALRSQFTWLHLEVDPSLERDSDYTDLFLWLTHALVRFFAEQGLPLDAAKVAAVAAWFAERSIENTEERKKEIELAAQAETSSQAGANLGVFSASLKLLARLQARVIGSLQQRTVIRQQLQYWSQELLEKVNDLLEHARTVLKAADRPGRLLIVQDNLDRMLPESALRLFRDNGDMLTKIEADCIWTAPINAQLAPFDIGRIFPSRFTMPTVKIHDRDNAPVPDGIEGLVTLLAQRIELGLVFASREVAAFLAARSGGSVRDLLRLVGQAALAAQVDDYTVIEQDSAAEAVKKLRIDFQGRFVPGDAYYPLLATVFFTKRDAGLMESGTPEQAASNQHFFAELLVNGSVLEYNGEESWFDVHPAILDIRAFRDACQDYQPKAKESRPAD